MQAINLNLAPEERYGGILGGAALLAVIAGFVISPANAFPSYLIGFLFWIGLTLGCLPLLMLHHLTGGKWGYALRPFLNAGLATLPLMALLIVPIFFGLQHLYPWAGLAGEHTGPVLRARAFYLNTPGMVLRAMVAFSLWLGLSYLLVWRRTSPDEQPARIRSRLQLTSGLGLAAFMVVTSFVFIDWLMAVEATWYSSIFPAIVVVGQVLCALALTLLLRLHWADANRPEVEQLNHLASLLFAFVLVWAYLSVSQLIIIYAGNLPHEINWYLRRTRNGWLGVALILVTVQFVLPFCLLLFRGIKRSPRMLTALAVAQLAVQAVAMFWYTAPAFRPTLRIAWTDPVAFVGIGAAWTFVYRRQALRETPPNAPHRR
ncbi:MAG TPA: hypothetical protein VGD78_14405 [Chthoniobacterales bacterium]